MIYVLCFSISILFAYLASRSKNKGVFYLCSAISILVPCILGGLRAYGIGTDTRIYGQPQASSAFRSPSFAYYLKENSWLDPGYKLITYVIMKTFGHVNWCYFFYQLITISCVYIGAYKHRKQISFPFTMLLWMFSFYNNTYNIMRQFMAASIIFMNIDQLESRQYKKFAVTIAVAFLFHHSAVMLFVLFIGMHSFVASKTLAKNLWLKLIIFYGVILASFFIRPALLSILNLNSTFAAKYSGYIMTNMEERLGRTVVLITIGEILMTFLYRRNGELVLAGKNGCRNNIDFYKYNLIFFLLCYFVIRLMTGRIVMYTSFINILLMAALPHFVKEKHLRFMVAMAVVGYCSLQWWYNNIHLALSETYPYRSILDDMLL